LEVVVLHKDRLCQFGYELIAKILGKFDVKLVMHSQDQETEQPNRKLEQDLVSLVKVFVAKKMENTQQRTEDEESEKPSKKRKKNPSTKNPSNKPPAGKAIRYSLYPTSDQK
jgi:predicted site-specific integrase-resolvase